MNQSKPGVLVLIPLPPLPCLMVSQTSPVRTDALDCDGFPPADLGGERRGEHVERRVLVVDVNMPGITQRFRTDRTRCVGPVVIVTVVLGLQFDFFPQRGTHLLLRAVGGPVESGQV